MNTDAPGQDQQQCGGTIEQATYTREMLGSSFNASVMARKPAVQIRMPLAIFEEPPSGCAAAHSDDKCPASRDQDQRQAAQGHMTAILAKGHGIKVAEPLMKNGSAASRPA
jgi:hypothetical protein